MQIALPVFNIIERDLTDMDVGFGRDPIRWRTALRKTIYSKRMPREFWLAP